MNTTIKQAILGSNNILDQVLKTTKKYYYKIRYDANTFLNSESQSHAWILGKEIHKKENILIQISKIIWMTYRQNMGKSQLIGSDVGWGCTVRVGQMLLAQAFKRTLQLKELQNGQYYQQVIKHIIQAFVDSSKVQSFGLYSIQKISQYANKQFGIQPGKWFNPANISYSLEQLHKTGPLSGTSQLIIRVGQEIQLQKFSKQMKSKGQNSSILIIILGMLGFNKCDKSKISAVQKMMKIKYFNGIMGGIPNKAFYFVGVTESGRFVYFDPHFVQKASTCNQIDFQSYFCNQYLSIGQEELQPSVGISFYADNLSQFQSLFQCLEKMKKDGCDIPFALVGETEPNMQCDIYECSSSSFTVEQCRSKQHEMKQSSIFQELSFCPENTQGFQVLELD